MAARLRIGACLSLTGRFARSGRQAAAGLEGWRSLTGSADVFVGTTAATGVSWRWSCRGLAARCEFVARPLLHGACTGAGTMAAERDWLVCGDGGLAGRAVA